METHRLHAELLERQVRVLVVGCGGTGSAILGGLPYLHLAMRAQGHPYGLRVTMMDGDNISPANCVRQPFSRAEVGLNKGIILVNRLNIFWGLDWEALPENLTENHQIRQTDVVIGCVDTRAARAVIEHQTSRNSAIHYAIDIGNSESSGQFILGEPLNAVNRRSRTRLRTAAELFPEIIDATLDNDGRPSCSTMEALERQQCFVNSVLAQHAWHYLLGCSGTAKSPTMAALWTSRVRGPCRSRSIRCCGVRSGNGDNKTREGGSLPTEAVRLSAVHGRPSHPR